MSLARIRTIKPEFNISESVSRMSESAQLFMVKMFPEVDDQGRIEWLPRKILGALYPHSDEIGNTELESRVSELEKEGIFQRYEVDGRVYGYFINWEKHQVVKNPSRARCPEPPSRQSEPKTQTLPEVYGESTEDVVSSSPLEIGNGNKEVGSRNTEIGVPVGTTGKPVVFNQEQIYGQVGYFLSEVAKQIGASPPTDAEIRQHIAKSSCVRKILDKCQPMSHAIEVGVFGMKTRPGVGWQGIWAGVSSIEAKLAGATVGGKIDWAKIEREAKNRLGEGVTSA